MNHILIYKLRMGFLFFKKLIQESGGLIPAQKVLFQAYRLNQWQGVKYACVDAKNRMLSKQYLAGKTNTKVTILTAQHTLYVAYLIVHILQKFGFNCEVITERPKAGYSNNWHFVICANVFKRLPAHFFVFQMEQSPSSHWFEYRYISRLEAASAIMDYSLVNIQFLKTILNNQNIYYVPIDYLRLTHIKQSHKEYDVVFYGEINNERRQKYIAALNEICSLKVINNLFGQPLQKELAKAKVVVNIHYYENALLETTRIYECLAVNAIVVSEKSVDIAEHTRLIGLVDFVETYDIAQMVECVKYWLSHEKERLYHLENQQKALLTIPNQFEENFVEFLLAQKMISTQDTRD